MKKGGYLDLFLTFARIGGLTFGGGYAMLPMLQKEVVENRGWATEEELLDQGIKPNTIRLSIGTENIDDIIEDLDEAFKAVQ